MNRRFADLVTPLENKCHELLAMSPVRASEVPGDTPVGGVYLFAREATGRRPTYRQNGSRKELLEDPEFRPAYDDARARIREMHVRYVHEPEPLRQALLEIYVAVTTAARYNDFDTH